MIVYKSRSSLPSIGWLERELGELKGLRLMLHDGLNLIGRASFYTQKELPSVVEQSQVLIQHMEGRLTITDATSTNQCRVIRARASAAYLADPSSVPPEAVIQLEHEALEHRIKDRCWHPLYEGDLIEHIYGVWRVKLSAEHDIES